MIDLAKHQSQNCCFMSNYLVKLFSFDFSKSKPKRETEIREIFTMGADVVCEEKV